MKAKLSLVLMILALSPVPFALSQIPQGINYQAIARDGSGAILDNKTFQVELTIQTSTGTPVWRESKSLSSNQFGLIATVLGTGPNQLGLPATFEGIDWNAQSLFLKTRVQYPGTTWNDMGSTQIWSVPYALVAKDVEGPLSKLNISGTSTLPEESLFEVKNKSGEVIFAVYNEGVRVYVPEGAKGAKGGFAVSGFSSNKTLPENYLFVSPDSIRAYIWDDPIIKGAKGGFMVSGFNSAKSITNNFLEVNPDSVRIYIDKAPSTKGAKGGFAVSGFGTAKGENEEYLRVTRDSTRVSVSEAVKGQGKGGFAVGSFGTAKGPTKSFMEMTSKNYFIGDSAGAATTGIYNSFMGYKSGAKNTLGSTNAFFGYQAGYNNITGNSNLFLGYMSGYSNRSGSSNSFVGYMAGYDNTTGINNTFLGSYSSPNNTSGSFNTSVGFYAGFANSTNGYNCYFGYNAGYSNAIGNNNVFIGPGAGWQSVGGNDNVFIGRSAGSAYQGGNRNICVGTDAGAIHINTNDNIYIGYQSGQVGTGTELMTPAGDGNIWIGKYAGWNLGLLWYNRFARYSQSPLPLVNTFIIDNNDHSQWVAPPPVGSGSPDLAKYPLMFGNFSYTSGQRCVIINGVDNNGRLFWVNGLAGGTSSWGALSDIRAKKNISEITDALSKVMKLRGVNFEWIDTIKAEKGIQMGFIAQEALGVIPEVVKENGGSYSMYYAPITALLVEGMKDQQKIIDAQKELLEKQEKQIQSLNVLIPAISEQQRQIDELKAIVEQLAGEKFK